MSHSRSQSRPPPKNPLPARSFPAAQVISGWLFASLSYILYLISQQIITFKCYSILQLAGAGTGAAVIFSEKFQKNCSHLPLAVRINH